MPDIGELMGALLSSLAHARRIADEESAAIAEYYRSNPLLEGMSIPRVRVPEMTLDLPVLITEYEGGAGPTMRDEDQIVEAVKKEMRGQLEMMDLKASREFQIGLGRQIKTELAKIRVEPGSGSKLLREHVVRAVDRAFSDTVLKYGLPEKMKAVQLRELSRRIGRAAEESAVKDEGLPPRIAATILTADVKEQAGADNVVRLKLTIREEGMEWDVIDQPDGTTTRRLSPE